MFSLKSISTWQQCFFFSSVPFAICRNVWEKRERGKVHNEKSIFLRTQNPIEIISHSKAPILLLPISHLFVFLSIAKSYFNSHSVSLYSIYVNTCILLYNSLLNFKKDKMFILFLSLFFLRMNKNRQQQKANGFIFAFVCTFLLEIHGKLFLSNIFGLPLNKWLYIERMM